MYVHQYICHYYSDCYTLLPSHTISPNIGIAALNVKNEEGLTPKQLAKKLGADAVIVEELRGRSITPRGSFTLGLPMSMSVSKAFGGLGNSSVGVLGSGSVAKVDSPRDSPRRQAAGTSSPCRVSDCAIGSGNGNSDDNNGGGGVSVSPRGDSEEKMAKSDHMCIVM
jgi:hypothetical protein